MAPVGMSLAVDQMLALGPMCSSEWLTSAHVLSYRLWACASLARIPIHHGKNLLEAKMAVDKRPWSSC